MIKFFALCVCLVLMAACTAPPPPAATPASNANSAATKSPSLSEADAIAREKAAWDSIKKKDWDGFGNILASEYVEITGDGIFDKSGIIADLKNVSLSDVTYSDWKMIPVDKDALVLNYSFTIKGTYKNAAIPAGPYRAGSAWVNRDGKWQAIYYQETLAKPASSPAPAPPAATGSPAVKPSTGATAAVTGPDAVANEKMVWDALKSKNYDQFGSYLAPEMMEVEPDGVYDKAASIIGVSSADFSNFQLSDWKSTKIDADSALVTYVVTMTGAKPSKERHSSIWANRNGKWLALYHQGTPIQATAAAPAPPAKPAAKQ